MPYDVIKGFQAAIEWAQSQWQVLSGGGVVLWVLLQSRHQRVTRRLSDQKLILENEKLSLELKATAVSLTRKELDRIVNDLTGRSLPETADPQVAFRAALDEWAKSKANAELHAQLDRLKEQLAATEDVLAPFLCPHCRAPIVETMGVPLDNEHGDYGEATTYACGHATSDAGMGSPCPSDPTFPSLDEFELKTIRQQDGEWSCHVRPKTSNARRLRVSSGYGRTEDEAVQYVKDAYDRAAQKPKRTTNSPVFPIGNA